MNKLAALKTVNLALFLSFVLQSATALFIIFKIRTLWAPKVYEVHEYNGLLMIALALVHLGLNWNWVQSAFLRRR